MKKLVLLLLVCACAISCKHKNPPEQVDECTRDVIVIKLEKPEQHKYILAKCTDEWVFPACGWFSQSQCLDDSLFVNPYIYMEEGYVMVNWLWHEEFCLFHPNYGHWVDGQIVESEETQFCYLPDYEWADSPQLQQISMSRDTTNVVVIAPPFVRFINTKNVERNATGKLVEEDTGSHEYSLRYGCGLHVTHSCERTQDELRFTAIQAEWKDMLNQLILDGRIVEMQY